jgi:chemotaxis protein histidine kinase CheA
LRPFQVGEQRSRLLLLQVGESRLAVPADSVSSIIDIDTDTIHPRSVTAFPLSRSEVRIGDEVLPLFEPALILESAEGA